MHVEINNFIDSGKQDRTKVPKCLCGMGTHSYLIIPQVSYHCSKLADMIEKVILIH